MYVWGPCNNLLEVYISIKEKNMFFKVARPHTVRKKLSKIENSISIYSLGGVTPIYRWISMIYDFHSTPVVKIHENLNFLPIFFFFFIAVRPRTLKRTQMSMTTFASSSFSLLILWNKFIPRSQVKKPNKKFNFFTISVKIFDSKSNYFE